ncbi:MAG: hypothetical protein ACXIVQ_05375 [Acidimicrobiales bacterium]
MTSIVIVVHSRLHQGRARAVRLAGALVGDDRGEGVISTAIAVLVMAFLGAAMWLSFNAIWGDAEQNIGSQVDQIGR